MPTQLTSPIAKNAVSATLDSWHLEVSRDPATLAVILPETTFTATVKFRYADGSEADKKVYGRAVSDINGASALAIRNFHNAVITYLRAQGILPAGTDTQDV